MDKNIIEAGNLPLTENVYLKKDMFGWRVVEPPTLWYHWIVGSKRNMFQLFILLIVVGLLYFGILELIDSYRMIAENPCLYCDQCSEVVSQWGTFQLYTNITK